ncbi:MAG: serine protease, partial [Magnetococcus sp. DMHC-8]
MTTQRKSMRKTIDYPFCRQPWHIGLMLLGICYVFTMVWAFHLLHEDLEESLDFLRFGKKSSSSSEQGRSGAQAVTAALNTVVSALPPGQVPADIRVRAALVNIAGLRVASGGGPGQFASTGSGVLVTANGYVVTAAHVVSGLTEILVRVQTPSGPRQYTAQLVKKAPNHDVAVLKLASRDLFPYLPLAPESAVPKVGARVVAWGDPDTANAVVNRGKVTQVDAVTVVEGVSLAHLLRTSAVSHWAQSGGPLLDEQGRLVGINIAAQSGSGSVGYAVPADVLWAHFQDVVNFPQATRPQAALPMAPVTPVAAVAGGDARMVPVAQTAAVAGREPRRADGWWAQAQAAYGGGQTAGPVSGMHVAMVTPQPQMVPAAHVAEQMVWGYPLHTLLGLVALGLVSGISGGMMTMGGGIIK